MLKIRIYKIVNLPVVLYGCETWSFPFTGERNSKLSENEVLRKIFGSSKYEISQNYEDITRN
jgi:hypothetical protein